MQLPVIDLNITFFVDISLLYLYRGLKIAL